MSSIRSRHRGSRGFGLLELVVYLGISAVVMTATFGFLADVLRQARKTRAISDADHAVRVTSMRLLHEVRSASGIIDASSSFGSVDGRLSLSTATGTVEFYLSASRALMVRDASGTGQLTPSNVRVRVFRVDPVAVTSASPRSVRFTIEAESSRDARAETGASVRSSFGASLR